MGEIQHIWSCSCGAETPCRREDHEAGAVYQCPACKQVFGCVRRPIGPKVWVKINDDDVRFHELANKEG